MKTILVTGGLGFIGSETVIELIESGYEPIVLDNLYNSKLAVLDRIETITHVRPKFYEVDCTKYAETVRVFEENHIDAVIHFAGYKAVGESTVKPVEYYQNNLGSALNVLAIMKEKGVHNFIFLNLSRLRLQWTHWFFILTSVIHPVVSWRATF